MGCVKSGELSVVWRLRSAPIIDYQSNTLGVVCNYAATKRFLDTAFAGTTGVIVILGIQTRPSFTEKTQNSYYLCITKLPIP